MSTRGQGSVWRPKYRARDGTMKESAVWWICYYQGRKRVRESSGTTVKREAVQILTRKLAQGGRAIPRRKLEKVRIIYRLTGPGLDEKSVARSIELSEEKYCSVGATFKNTVEVSWEMEVDGRGE